MSATSPTAARTRAPKGRTIPAQGKERSDAALGFGPQNTSSPEGAKELACPPAWAKPINSIYRSSHELSLFNPKGIVTFSPGLRSYPGLSRYGIYQPQRGCDPPRMNATFPTPAPKGRTISAQEAQRRGPGPGPKNTSSPEGAKELACPPAWAKPIHSIYRSSHELSLFNPKGIVIFSAQGCEATLGYRDMVFINPNGVVTLPV